MIFTLQNRELESFAKKLHKPFKFKIIRFNASEFKLLVLFCYYWITILIRVIFHGLLLRNRNRDLANKYLLDYTSCSFGGYRDECRVFEEQLREETIVLLVIGHISTMFLSLVNLINLFFVIQFSDIKERFKRLFSK